MSNFPAINVHGADDPDLLLALVDDFSPSALEQHGDLLRIFFPTSTLRDRALADLAGGPLAGSLRAEAVDVPDEDWARRSQADLKPITVGNITVAPPWAIPATSNQHPATIVIAPSTGFGTGHHATTRLCLRALQEFDVAGKTVLDVGTGSGVLAIAASRLGAARAIGLEVDPDALDAARENLALNPGADVDFLFVDAGAAALPQADVVVANLTGATLVRLARPLADAVRSAGVLIVSGVLAEERDDVKRAFGRLRFAWEAIEEEWVALAWRQSVERS